MTHFLQMLHHYIGPWTYKRSGCLIRRRGDLFVQHSFDISLKFLSPITHCLRTMDQFLLLLFQIAIVIIQILNAQSEHQKIGFRCTNEYSGCAVDGDFLRFFVLGDIGGEEYTMMDAGTMCSTRSSSKTVVADGNVHEQRQQQKNEYATTDEVSSCAEMDHRPSKAQKAVAKAMHLLSKRGMGVHFLLNTGDNFYEKGVTFADAIARFTNNFVNVYDYPSLAVPWYTIGGNKDWESVDGIQPQIDFHDGKWTFPAQQYVVHYTVGQHVHVRFVFIDSTMLCGTGANTFTEAKEANNEQKYVKMVNDAKKQFTWVRKQLREANQKGVHFLFLVGHHPLYKLPPAPQAYPCASQLHKLMKQFRVQAYFSGHHHCLKHVDLGSFKFIVSGAGSRMESTLMRGDEKHSADESSTVKFRYPKNVGKRTRDPHEFSPARGVLDGGAFVGVEIDAKKMEAKFKFYAAGMVYDGNAKKEEKALHEFETEQFTIGARNVEQIGKKFDNICDELALLSKNVGEEEEEENVHFEKNKAEQIQAILGTYFCKNLSAKERGKSKFDENGKTDEQFRIVAEEIFEKLRNISKISCQHLADSFLSGDLVEEIEVSAEKGKISHQIYRTTDKKFLLKDIGENEMGALIKTLPNYLEYLAKNGGDDERSFLNRVLMAFTLKIGKEGPTEHFILIANALFAESAKTVVPSSLLIFEFSQRRDTHYHQYHHQRQLLDEYQQQDNKTDQTVLQWYHFFGGTIQKHEEEDNSVPRHKVAPMFNQGIVLDKSTHQNIAKWLNKDFEFLVSNSVNDWSIIVGVFFEKDAPQKNASGKRASSSDAVVRNTIPPFFRARCSQCRTHVESFEFLNGQELRLYIGIVHAFAPFNDQPQQTFEGNGTGKGNNLRLQRKAGPTIPPKIYADRMLALSVACAFRWWQKEHAASAPEAIRQALIRSFCGLYWHKLDNTDTPEHFAMVAEGRDNKNWMDKWADEQHCFDQHTVTVFAVSLFSNLMHREGKYLWWNFLIDLADDNLKNVRGKIYAHRHGNFVIRKATAEEQQLFLKQQHMTALYYSQQSQQTPHYCAFLELKENNKNGSGELFVVLTGEKEDISVTDW